MPRTMWVLALEAVLLLIVATLAMFRAGAGADGPERGKE